MAIIECNLENIFLFNIQNKTKSKPFWQINANGNSNQTNQINQLCAFFLLLLPLFVIYAIGVVIWHCLCLINTECKENPNGLGTQRVRDWRTHWLIASHKNFFVCITLLTDEIGIGLDWIGICMQSLIRAILFRLIFVHFDSSKRPQRLNQQLF